MSESFFSLTRTGFDNLQYRDNGFCENDYLVKRAVAIFTINSI